MSAVSGETPTQVLARLGITLPPARTPKFRYRSVVVVESLVYVSGVLALEPDGSGLAYRGRLGEDLDTDAGRLSARGAAISLLASLHHGLAEQGGLDAVEGIVKLLGFVRAVPDFGEAPHVIDGASELLADVFGSDRLSSRSAIGVAALPAQGSVELEAIARLRVL